MNQIDNLSDDADQLTSLILPDGTVLTLEFIYRAGTQRWTVNVQHATLATNNLNLCQSPNLLREWRNIINFGIACTSTDGVDPNDIEDFASGRIQVYLLTEAEVAQVETDILGSFA